MALKHRSISSPPQPNPSVRQARGAPRLQERVAAEILQLSADTFTYAAAAETPLTDVSMSRAVYESLGPHLQVRLSALNPTVRQIFLRELPPRVDEVPPTEVPVLLSAANQARQLYAASLDAVARERLRVAGGSEEEQQVATPLLSSLSEAIGQRLSGWAVFASFNAFLEGAPPGRALGVLADRSAVRAIAQIDAQSDFDLSGQGIQEQIIANFVSPPALASIPESEAKPFLEKAEGMAQERRLRCAHLLSVLGEIEARSQAGHIDNSLVMATLSAATFLQTSHVFDLLLIRKMVALGYEASVAERCRQLLNAASLADKFRWLDGSEVSIRELQDRIADPKSYSAQPFLVGPESDIALALGILHGAQRGETHTCEQLFDALVGPLQEKLRLWDEGRQRSYEGMEVYHKLSLAVSDLAVAFLGSDRVHQGLKDEISMLRDHLQRDALSLSVYDDNTFDKTLTSHIHALLRNFRKGQYARPAPEALRRAKG